VLATATTVLLARMRSGVERCFVWLALPELMQTQREVLRVHHAAWIITLTSKEASRANSAVLGGTRPRKVPLLALQYRRTFDAAREPLLCLAFRLLLLPVYPAPLESMPRLVVPRRVHRVLRENSAHREVRLNA
jgi:hypothetical protein